MILLYLEFDSLESYAKGRINTSLKFEVDCIGMKNMPNSVTKLLQIKDLDGNRVFDMFLHEKFVHFAMQNELQASIFDKVCLYLIIWDGSN